jgi:hypothetical protein
MAALDASQHVKTRFLLSEHGKKLLLNTNNSFQPRVSHSIVSSIKCSLTTKNLYCPQKKTCIDNSTKNMIYVHEAKNINNDISLGAFPYKFNSLEETRHCILGHLAGWPEGAAIFALHQMFGTSVFFQNAIDKIFRFVKKLSSGGENDGNSVDNANNGSVFESDYFCANGGDAEVDRDEKVESSVEMEDDLYEWMNSVFDGSGSEDDIRNSFESFDGSQKRIVNPAVFDKEKVEATVSTSRDIGNGKTELVSKNVTKKSLNVDDETSSKHDKVNSFFDITDVSSNEGNNMQRNDITVLRRRYRRCILWMLYSFLCVCMSVAVYLIVSSSVGVEDLEVEDGDEEDGDVEDDEVGDEARILDGTIIIIVCFTIIFVACCRYCVYRYYQRIASKNEKSCTFDITDSLSNEGSNNENDRVQKILV